MPHDSRRPGQISMQIEIDIPHSFTIAKEDEWREGKKPKHHNGKPGFLTKDQPCTPINEESGSERYEVR